MDYQSEKNYLLKLWGSNPKGAFGTLKKENAALFEKIADNQTGNSFSEKVWRYVYQLDPTCSVCNKPAKFLDFRRGFTMFCSVSCMSRSTTTADKKRNTCISKYGVKHFSKTSSYKEKFKNTLMSKYGVTNPGQIEALKTARSRSKQLTFYNSLSKFQDYSVPLFTFEEYTRHNDSSLKWKCVHCNNEFLDNILGKIPKCPSCFPKGFFGKQSNTEKEILEEIRKFYSGEIIENSRSIIKPKELDLYFPLENFAIEFNGSYWHSDDQIDNMYHQKKFILCNEHNIKLLMISDHEWFNHKELTLSMIKHRLNIKNNNNTVEKIHTRKCIVKLISIAESKKFLNQYHVSGAANASEHLGLFFNSTLLAVCTISHKNRFKNLSNCIEIVRLAFSRNLPGALGKFLKYINEKYPNIDIETYADLRYGTGAVYLKNNFTLVGMTKPGYWYWYKDQIYHRLSWTKKKLVKMGYDPTLTEKQIMNNINAIRIYDCGHYLYKLYKGGKP
jgi:hypothetical protein